MRLNCSVGTPALWSGVAAKSPESSSGSDGAALSCTGVHLISPRHATRTTADSLPLLRRCATGLGRVSRRVPQVRQGARWPPEPRQGVVAPGLGSLPARTNHRMWRSLEPAVAETQDLWPPAWSRGPCLVRSARASADGAE